MYITEETEYVSIQFVDVGISLARRQQKWIEKKRKKYVTKEF